jgi:hypothetical protein
MLSRSGQLRILVALTLAIATLLAVACGGQKQDRPLPEGLGDALKATSAFQRNLLQDGELTYSEYESSVLATVQCLKDRGVTISVEPRLVPGKRLEFAYETSEANDASASSAYDDCYREYENLVDIVWYRQNAPSQQQLDAARAALADCLRKAGVDLPEHPTSTDFRRLATVGNTSLFACQEEVSREFDISQSFIG